MVIELDKARRTVADVRFGWQGRCTVDVDYAIAGRRSRSKASGSFSVRFARTDAAGAVTQDCDSGKVSWPLPTT